MTANEGVRITWLGHAATLMETPDGKRILIDPFIQGNPAVPDDWKNIDRLDLMLITHGHADHMADAVPIAQRTRPDVVAMFDITSFLETKGVEKTIGMNKGGTVHWNGVDITMVDAIHSSTITDGDRVLPGGSAAGYVLVFSNGFTVYFSGDTDVFESMRLIGDLYQPDLAMLPIGGHFTMDPKTAAHAIRLLGVDRVIPIHYGTFPVLTGTPEELKRAAADIQGLHVIALKPGESIAQTQLL